MEFQQPFYATLAHLFPDILCFQTVAIKGRSKKSTKRKLDFFSHGVHVRDHNQTFQQIVFQREEIEFKKQITCTL